MTERIIRLVKEFFPQIQAIYLFGSHADNTAGDKSDVDVALLLPPADAVKTGELSYSNLRFALEKELRKSVDLINLRLATTVFQNEICKMGKLLYSGDEYDRELFEMLLISYYCKLNDERSGILEDILDSRRAYQL